MADAKIINYGQPIGAGSTAIPDNQDAVVVIESSDNEFIRVDSTEGNERVKLVHTEFFLKSDSMNDTARGEIIPAGSAMTIRAPASGCDIVLSPGNTENLRAIAEGGLASPLYTVGMFATTGGGTVGTGGSSDATLEQSGASTFQTALHVGAAIKIVDSGDGEVFLRTVASITDANTLEMDEAAVVENGSAWYHDSGELFAAKTGDRKTLFAVDATGAIQAGSAAADSTVQNFAIGDSDALDTATSGTRNYFIGHASDNYKITTGSKVIGLGYAAGEDNSSGSDSIYIGAYAGQEVNNDNNVYIGSSAGKQATGGSNIAIGTSSMTACTGSDNVAIGSNALDASGAAASSVAIGKDALTAATGSSNTAVGLSSLGSCAAGQNNTAIGISAGSGITGGGDCVMLGKETQASGENGNNQIAVGKGATGHADNKATIGNASITSIDPHSDRGCDLGQVAYEFDAVHCVSVTEVSDERLKENISDTAMGLNFINALRPVSYKFKDIEHQTKTIEQPAYRQVVDDSGELVTESFTEEHEVVVHPGKVHTRHHQGLIAQEVKTVLDSMGISAADFGGFVDGNVVDGVDKLALRYTQFIGPLIKAVQELTARVAELEAGD